MDTRKVTALNDVVLEGKDGSEKPVKAGETVELSGKEWKMFCDHVRRSDACVVEVVAPVVKAEVAQAPIVQAPVKAKVEDGKKDSEKK